MIVLKVRGLAVDLPAGLQMQRELETSIFRRDGEATDFVYPVDLPLTDNNKIAFYQPHMIANNTHRRTYECELIVDGIYARGVLYVENVSLQNKIIRVSISGDYGGFWKDAQEIRVNELTLGGIRTVGTINTGAAATKQIATNVTLEYIPCTTGDHIEDVMDGTTVTDYLFYPAVDEKINISGLHDKTPYTSIVITTPVRSLINRYFYNDAGDKGIIDPIKSYIETHLTVMKQGQSRERYFWVPYLRLSFVIKKCFEDLGYSVFGSILSDANFNVITLYNTYAINRCIVEETVVGPDLTISISHNATQIDPRNHVPRISVTEFLREIAKAFNLQFDINYGTKEVEINVVGQFTPSAGNIFDITSKVSPNPEISFEDFNATNGYEFEFEADENDGAIFHHVANNLDAVTIMSGTYNAYEDLAGIGSPVNLDVAYVNADNAYYQYFSADGSWHWFGYNPPKYAASNSDGLEKITTKAVPVSVAKFFWLARMDFPNGTFLADAKNIIQDQGHTLPVSKLGIEGIELLYISFAELFMGGISAYQNTFQLLNASVNHVAPHLCNYLGFAYPSYSASVATHPCGNSDIHDAKGTARQGYRLYWNNPDGLGLYNSFWKRYVESLQGSVVAEYEMLWDTDSYRDIDLQTSFLKINDILFLCDKANIVFPFPSVGRIRLVRYG